MIGDWDPDWFWPEIPPISSQDDDNEKEEEVGKSIMERIDDDNEGEKK